jgi:hypothetical protein
MRSLKRPEADEDVYLRAHLLVGVLMREPISPELIRPTIFAFKTYR